ncbi:mitochondrial carrier protein [Aureococcus anophagefferens]|nr:mitochondrial carrier protein [Aureococcus anophagefferens]
MALARRAALLVMSLPLATTFVAPRPPRRAAVAAKYVPLAPADVASCSRRRTWRQLPLVASQLPLVASQLPLVIASAAAAPPLALGPLVTKALGGGLSGASAASSGPEPHVEGSVDGLGARVAANGPAVLWRGCLAAAAATFVGNYPWFLTYNYLGGVLPAADPASRLARRALGVAASCASDVCSNGLRVVKTKVQTSPDADAPLDVARVLDETAPGLSAAASDAAPRQLPPGRRLPSPEVPTVLRTALGLSALCLQRELSKLQTPLERMEMRDELAGFR